MRYLMTGEKMKEVIKKTGEDISRRDWLKITGTTIGLITFTQVISFIFSKRMAGAKNRVSIEPGEGHRWGMGIDINLCIGCNYCTYACQAVNNLSDEMIYNVVTQEATPSGEAYFLSRPCMHCDHPPCVHVCPVGSTYLRDDGIVTMDYDRCIGCRYCEVACPYDARVFNWRTPDEENSRVRDVGSPEVPMRPRGVAEKCTFCEHRIDSGLERGLTPGVDPLATPACVVACPTEARIFGDLNDKTSPISIFLQSTKAPLRLREELSTEPKVFYKPPRNV
jgi:Fe-S-cluster-containing dehydrogenase component